MKFTIDSKELITACTEVSKAITNKTIMPILNGIKMSAKDNTLTLSGYDLELGIEANIPIIAEEDGTAVTCNSKLFMAALQKYKGEVTVETSGSKIVLSAGKQIVDLVGFEAENYPSLPTSDYDNEISGQALSTALEMVAFAIREENEKKSAQGALLTADGNNITVVGMDGCRIAIYTAESKAKKMTCIIPKNALPPIIALAQKSETVKFGLTNNLLFIGTDSSRIITRIIGEEYIDYKKILKNFETGFWEIEIDKTALVDALELSRVLTNDRDRAPTVLSFNPGKGLDVSIKTTLGKSENCIACDCENELKIAFSAANLTEAIKRCRGGKVKMFFSKALAPVKIIDEEYMAIVMPVRLKD